MDANILVSLLYEEERSQQVKAALEKILELQNSELVTSEFAFVETAKALINSKGLKPKDTAKRVNEAQRDNRAGNIPFKIIPTSNDKDYGFESFWTDVGQNMNLYNPGWGDAIHCVIMKNNGVKNIISVDAKDDFEIVPGLVLLHPEAILGNDEPD